MKKIKIVMLGLILVHPLHTALAQMEYVENTREGTLTVLEGGKDILTYRFGDQIKEGADQNQMRSCYIHPLCAPDGEVLTDDFPADHLHHHGLFWTWPGVITRGQNTQTWHPANLRQHFVRWVKREAEGGFALFEVENAWQLDTGEVVARETVRVHIFPSDGTGRAIDLSLTIQAVGGLLTLRGSPEAAKAYGGLSFRGAPFFEGAAMTTDKGELNEDSDAEKFLWADVSAGGYGVAVFVSPGHPGRPVVWCIRNSYAGFINPSWPGLEPATLEPGSPVNLAYRIYVHRGGASEAKVAEAYKNYISKNM